MDTGHETRDIPYFLYGTAWKEQDTARCVTDALKAGFRGIDTANQRVHYNEAGVGEALKAAYEDGLVEREDLFLQSKFTLPRGQDHRLPYDANAPVAEQVRQSFESSLEHLATDRIDSYVLHGPATPFGLTDEDWAMWRAMEALQREGRVRYLGLSNVSLEQLRAFFEGAEIKPRFVQNRCFAKTLWDREIREYCREQDIIYQGFSLLTANAVALKSAELQEIALRLDRTVPQVVFRFALEVGMTPLTGTTDPKHMDQDLAALYIELHDTEISLIERVAAA